MDIKELILKAKELQGIEVKEEIVEEQKANEVMHTTNTGFWKETVPVNVLLDPALDMLPKYSSLINLLPIQLWTCYQSIHHLLTYYHEITVITCQ